MADAPCLSPYNIQVGHAQVQSSINLARCTRWLMELEESSPKEAARVLAALPISHHASEEERARGRPDGLIPAVGNLGEFPWAWCVSPHCTRCYGPLARGGYHFRHAGPWTGDADARAGRA